jgi:transcriptional regulator GlxA family with amidase domain
VLILKQAALYGRDVQQTAGMTHSDMGTITYRGSCYAVRYRTKCKQFFVMKPKTAEKSDSTHPKRQNESTRERVLEAAFTLFCEHGFSDVSTLEIATRAQVSKRDLYALFRNKQVVLADCIKERAQRSQFLTQKTGHGGF